MTLQLLSTNPPVVLLIDANGQSQLLSTLSGFEDVTCSDYHVGHDHESVVRKLCLSGQLEIAQKLSQYLPIVYWPLVRDVFHAGHVHVVRWLLTLSHVDCGGRNINTADFIIFMIEALLGYKDDIDCVWWLMATLPASEFWRLHAKHNETNRWRGGDLCYAVRIQIADMAPVRAHFMLQIAPELTQRIAA